MPWTIPDVKKMDLRDPTKRPLATANVFLYPRTIDVYNSHELDHIVKRRRPQPTGGPAANGFYQVAKW